MTRPLLVRQDTIDLQDQDGPSAQSHPKTHLKPNGLGQSQTTALKHVAEEQYEERFTRSPRVSGEWSDVFDGSGVNARNGQHVNGSAKGRYDQSQDEDEDDYEHQHTDDRQQTNGDGDDYDHEQLTEEETDTDGDDNIDDDLMDKISSSPSISGIDDIDDSLVYALHTFVATVEGQANASKGDHMILLDDSNSYWWLVKLVKDESIGYLPAEHIETPNERWARLNKHRNGAASASQLTDHEPSNKSKNPFAKFVPGRKSAKNVTWGLQPTFFEPPAENFSDEESEQEDGVQAPASTAAATTTSADQDQDEITPVEPLRVRTSANGDEGVKGDRVVSEAGSLDSQTDPSSPEQGQPRASDKKADLFLKDESVEPRKISLTPHILKEDSDAGMKAAEPKEPVVTRPLKPKGSLEALEKSRNSMSSIESNATLPGKEKKEKKKKGMLGLFKRRERKSKIEEHDELTDFLNPEKLTEQSSRDEPESRQGSVASPPTSPKNAAGSTAERRPSKLQKKTPASLVAASAASQRDSGSISSVSSQTDLVSRSSSTTAPSTVAAVESSPLAQKGLGEQVDTLATAPTRPLTTREAMAAEARQAQQQQIHAQPTQPAKSSQPEPVQTAPKSILVDHPLTESLGRNSPLDRIANLSQPSQQASSLGGWGPQQPDTQSDLKGEDAPQPQPRTKPLLSARFHDQIEPAIIVNSPTSPASVYSHHPPAPTGEPPTSSQDQTASLAPSAELERFRQHSRQRSRDIESVSLSSAEQPMEKAPKRSATPPSPVSPQSSAGDDSDYEHTEIRETYEPDGHDSYLDHSTTETVTASGYQPRQHYGDTRGDADSTPSIENSSASEQNGKGVQTPSTVNTTATWSDAGLRSWFEGDRGMQEVRDLLVIVGDVNDVQPVEDDHPAIKEVFGEETKTLDGLQEKLDNMLDSFLRRKNLIKPQPAPASTAAPVGSF